MIRSEPQESHNKAGHTQHEPENGIKNVFGARIGHTQQSEQRHKAGYQQRAFEKAGFPFGHRKRPGRREALVGHQCVAVGQFRGRKHIVYAVGQKHKILRGSAAVGRRAEHQVDAETRPGLAHQVRAQQLPHRSAHGQFGAVEGDLVKHGLLHDVTNPCGAVVVKKIVFIIAVFLFGIFL